MTICICVIAHPDEDRFLKLLPDCQWEWTEDIYEALFCTDTGQAWRIGEHVLGTKEDSFNVIELPFNFKHESVLRDTHEHFAEIEIPWLLKNSLAPPDDDEDVDWSVSFPVGVN